MVDIPEDETLAERRLALDESKWSDERALRQRELDLKARESAWSVKIFSPLTATLFAGLVTIIGSVTATLIQNQHSQTLERQKYETTKELEREKFETTKVLEQEKFNSSSALERQKQQHELVLKMISVGDETQARNNLAFLAEVGLVDEKLAKRIQDAKTTGVLPTPADAAKPPVQRSPVTPGDAQRLISTDAIELILEYEVGGRSAYEQRFSSPIATEVGVSIGIAYNLGHRSQAQLLDDWRAYLQPSDLEQLGAAAGVRGPKAKELAEKLAAIKIPWDVAVAQFREKEIPRWATILERDLDLPNVRDLPADSYGALLSLLLNRGTGFRGTGERSAEMRQIRLLIEGKEWGKIPEQIKAMERLWTQPGLKKRRHAEAKLFEKGLSSDAREK